MFWHIFFGHYTQETQLKIERKYFYHFKTIEVKAFLKKKKHQKQPISIYLNI